ncbi:MAG: hypothetical protein QOG09_454 [Solirubrobacterales bacterium]|jgi:hypothetical protein|nr:hypothetical protein [Solirubrobacterales bacterium]MDX6662352.1 hypothetical protein [Solirubrobacterales bacterium]
MRQAGPPVGAPATRWLTAVLFAALVVATVAAFAYAQRAKHRDLLLDRVRVTQDFSPNGDGRRDVAYLRFRVSRPDRANVAIVDETGRTIRSIARDKPLRSYFYWVFEWDGRDDAGHVAPADAYRLRVDLLGQNRQLTITAPEIHLRRIPKVAP